MPLQLSQSMRRVGMSRSQNTPHDCDRVLEHLKRLALLLGRGSSVKGRVTEVLAYRQRDIVVISEDALRHGNIFAQQFLGFFEAL